MQTPLAVYAIPARKMEVFEDRVVFIPRNALANKDLPHESKTVYIRDITAVNFKEPTFFSVGYIQVDFMSKYHQGKPIHISVEDDYCVAIPFKKMVEPAKIAYNCIHRLLADHQRRGDTSQATDPQPTTPSKVPQPTQTGSVADEIRKFKTLCDDGIITQEEFEAKKKQLLGL